MKHRCAISGIGLDGWITVKCIEEHLTELIIDKLVEVWTCASLISNLPNNNYEDCNSWRWRLKSGTRSLRTKYWVSKFWAGVPGVYNICSKCVSAGCLGAGTAACITANSASMETLCPASALPPPDVRSRNCSKSKSFHTHYFGTTINIL